MSGHPADYQKQGTNLHKFVCLLQTLENFRKKSAPEVKKGKNAHKTLHKYLFYIFTVIESKSITLIYTVGICFMLPDPFINIYWWKVIYFNFDLPFVHSIA